MTSRKRVAQGFTIVELLIVIVVIAILAVIATISYNGISQRARNTARIVTVKQVINVINLYESTRERVSIHSMIPNNDAVCYGKGYIDVNEDGRGDCSYSGSTALTSNSAAVDALFETTGSYPNVNYPPVLISSPGYSYYSAGPALSRADFTIDGRPASFRMEFTLEGEDQDCGGMKSVLSPTGEANVMSLQGAKNTLTVNGVTLCSLDMSQFEN